MSNKKAAIIFVGIVLLLLYTIFYINISVVTYQTIQVLGAFAIIQFLFIVFSWKSITGVYIDAYIIFIIACYCFNLAQPCMEVFGIVSEERSIIDHYKWPLSIYSEAVFISMLFIMSFHFGAILSIKYHKRLNKINVEDHNCQIKAIYKVSILLAIISFPCYAYNTAIRMVVASVSGYAAIYDSDIGTIKIFQIIGDYYIPSVICLYFACESMKKHLFIVWGLIIATIVFPPLYIGGRSNAIIILAIILIIYSFFHKISVKKFLFIGGIAYLMLVLFAAIAGNRGEKHDGMKLNSVTEKKDNPAFYTLTEMGASIQPLEYCLLIIPNSKSFAYGESYAYSFTTVIPNVGLWDVHPATKYANLGNWLKDYLNIPFGPGFSIVAEGYYNFGYWGGIMMLLLGYCFARCFQNVSGRQFLINPIAFIISTVLLFLTIKMVRNSFEFSVRAIFYYCLPMYFVMRYIYKKRIKSIKIHAKINPKAPNRIAYEQ